jgi:DNA modification methylase
LNERELLKKFSVQEMNAPDARNGVRLHAWQKPDEIAERLISQSTEPGNSILDPFCGTGTFIAAASRLGCHASGCDADRKMLALCELRGLVITGMPDAA